MFRHLKQLQRHQLKEQVSSKATSFLLHFNRHLYIHLFQLPRRKEKHQLLHLMQLHLLLTLLQLQTHLRQLLLKQLLQHRTLHLQKRHLLPKHLLKYHQLSR